MQLVLNTHGLVLKVKNKVFYVVAGDQNRLISPEKINSIAITAPCMLSSAAIELAANAEIPIYFFDRIGEAKSCLRSPYFESLATLRRKQVYFADSELGAQWVVEQFTAKTKNQVKTLKYLKNRRIRHKKEIEDTIERLESNLETIYNKVQIPSKEWNASMMGWEGHQAKLYWQMISGCLPDDWHFEQRSRRPAKDSFNAMLNYLYGMLYTVVEQALFAAGLDPHLGILHTDNYDRPTLSYDLIEAFRPWVDLLIVEKVMRKEATSDFFEQVEGGIYLSQNGKRFLIPAFNGYFDQHIRWNGKQMSREAHIYHAAASLARQLNEHMKRP